MSTDNDLQARARELLSYDPLTGEFRWRFARRGIRAGAIAGGLAAHGYHRLRFNGKPWWAHRLAWLYVYGDIPKNEVDHIDGNRSNNAIANLRLATTRQNQQNKVVKRVLAPYRGICRHYNKWQAKIRINGKRTYLGLYDTAEEAHAAYAAAAAAHHGEFALSRERETKP